MGKKPKIDGPNPTSVSNRDVMQRLNFLYQASVYLNNVHSSSTLEPSVSTSGSIPTSKGKKRRCMDLNDLSRNYIETMRGVGTRTTVQLDPSVKRTLCKGCNTVLVPGSTATVRTKTSSTHTHIMVYTCTSCRYSYRIPATPIMKTDDANAALEMDVDVPQSQMSIQQATHVDVSQVPQQQQQGGKRSRSRKEKRLRQRLPPLFARDAGHVVFAGNEKVPTTGGSWNDGIFIT
ncbi:RNAse P Rpr2/Rpp21/SNM1 subunit domain-containing protein [Lentinula raphanica]|uniref:RNAse P Rpr2/Rpp21/SNM1 subunit domain-containing protein n=1 Tax=Lentinula raphanica TaxID=153919 RepID=A0AA38PAK5_9AGAR|nr:RNAse P Rpr2/Rpp21/SNM1 subunit domain-containing protein [Lentinula raphanica]KAJ3824150.1 RNAse P Rpr2/Rpp21/SNM1 subunit domain-containing protein [Lentinula raphanica]KAJ3839128.1 RNAse P Rpr2/Rpp21/SNM1 subunit domain-containing protein [Lentinula raphanica]KAJ3969911.1 RNAse P Rpr2/Rpp21/SNM1 subunit domain-containing protein [Lentinula raphanica]